MSFLCVFTIDQRTGEKLWRSMEMKQKQKKHFVEMRFHSADIEKNFNNGKSAAADVK